MRFFVSTPDARADVHVTVVGGPRLGSSSRASVDDVGDGCCCVRWEASTSGTYSISVSINGVVVHGCPLTCNVAEPLAVPKCTAYGDGLLRATAGSLAYFHVDLAEAEGSSGWEKAKDATPPHTLSCMLVCGGVRLAGTVLQLSGSLFRVEYLAEQAGEFRLELCLDGLPVEAGAGESGLCVEAGPVDGPSSAVRCISSPPGSQVGVAPVRVGDSLRLELLLVDAFGNAAGVGTRGERLSVGVEGIDDLALSWHFEPCADERSSAFVMRALAARSGEYRIHVAYEGLSLRGSPVRVLVLPARAQLGSLTVDGQGVGGAVAGAPATFALHHVRDGEPCDLSELGELLATLTPLRPGEGEAVHAKGGFAIVRARRDAHDMCVTALEVEYATRAAGDHWLEVTSASGEHAPGSPFALTIVPAQADAPSCELLAGAPTCVAAGQGWELLLRARDRFGNAWEVGGERGFCARLLAQPWSGEGAPAAVLSTVDLHDGRYLVCGHETMARAGAAQCAPGLRLRLRQHAQPSWGAD